MGKKIERQNEVAHYLLENPQASPEEIGEALRMTSRNTRHIINAMIESGIVIRSKHPSDGRRNRLSLSVRGIEALKGQKQNTAEQAIHRKLMDVANQLEERGMWRRAATVWAELSRLQKTVTGVASIASRRNRCIRTSRATA